MWWTLLALCGALLATPWLGWSADLTGWALLGGGDWAGAGFQTAALWLIVPTVVAGGVALALRRSRVAAGAAVPAVLGTAALIAAAVRSGDYVPWGTGMGLALVAYPGTLACLVAAAVVFARPTGRTGRAGAIAVAGVVLAGAVTAGHFVSADRFVRATTASAAKPAAVTGPPGRVLWKVSRPGRLDGSVLPDGLVVLAESGHEVAARDAATGVRRWHYARSDMEIDHDVLPAPLAPSDDGRTIVAAYAAKDGWYIIGLAADTGVVRWRRPLAGRPRPTRTLDADDLELTRHALVKLGHGEPSTAYATGTGRRLWTRTIAHPCVHGPVGMPGMTAALSCPPDPDRVDVQAIADSGRLRWVAHASAVRRVRALDAQSEIEAVTPDITLVLWSFFSQPSEALAALDTATGAPRWSTDAFHESFRAAGEHAVLTAQGSRERLRIRDAVTGALRPAQPPPNAIPPGWSSGDATIDHGRAYLTAVHGAQVRLLTLDLASGRVLGLAPLPTGTKPRDEFGSTHVSAGHGMALVTVDGADRSVAYAVRTPA